LWNGTNWYGIDADNGGFYTLAVPQGTYEFGCGKEGLGFYWEPGFVVDSNQVKNVTLTPSFNMQQVGGFLGTFANGMTLTARINITDPNNGNAPVTNLPASAFLFMVCNWNTQPSLKQDITSLATVGNEGNGVYNVTWAVNTSLPVFTNGTHFSLEARVGGAGVGWGFDVITGTVYHVTGYVTLLNGTAVVGAHVGLWNGTNWYGIDADNGGFYTLAVPQGTYEFGCGKEGLGFYWEPDVVVDADLVKNATLFPPLNIEPIGDTFLGYVTNGTELSIFFNVTGDAGGVEGLANKIHVFVTDWDVTPPDKYEATPLSEILDLGGGLYNVNFIVDTALPIFNNTDTGYSLDVGIGGELVGWGFQLLRGTLYTVSGYVTDPTDAAVVGAPVGIWNATFGFGNDTDVSGFYSILVSAGIYEFGVNPTPANPTLDFYYNSTFLVAGDVTFDVQLQYTPAPPTMQR
jgi:hypothetical protein